MGFQEQQLRLSPATWGCIALIQDIGGNFQSQQERKNMVHALKSCHQHREQSRSILLQPWDWMDRRGKFHLASLAKFASSSWNNHMKKIPSTPVLHPVSSVLFLISKKVDFWELLDPRYLVLPSNYFCVPEAGLKIHWWLETHCRIKRS